MIDACRFRIIRDSWQKTDKCDAANLSLSAVAGLTQQGNETAGPGRSPVVWAFHNLIFGGV